MFIRSVIRVFCVVIAAVFLQSTETDGAKILGLFTSYSPSHLIIHMSVMKALAEQGHNITVVSSLSPKVTHPTVKHIIIPPTKEQILELDKGWNETASTKNTMFSMVKGMFTNVKILVTMQVDTLKDERFTKLYEENFDLIFVEYAINDYQLGVAAKFNCPVIVIWMMNPMFVINDFVGNPEEVAYVPDINMVTTAGEIMGFGKRMQNYISTSIFKIIKIILNYIMNNYYRELFPTDNFPTYYDMKKNVSIVFTNSHFSEGFVRPNVPAMIEIGGIQVKDKPDALPKDIADFLETAKQDGAILFSLGTNLKGSNIKPEIIETIFKILSSLKQKIIWKWEDLKSVPGNSSNILYKKWLPQDDILAHPNTKLFVTHAGKGGIAEAQYHAVPMVALPVFGDQNANAEKMALSGYGQSLDMLSLNEKEFKETILEVLNNSKYKRNVQQFSDLYRDRPLTAKQSVIFWTEYVLRHHGARHMQSPLVHLNWFQQNSLDVIGALILSAYVVCKLLKVIFRLICNKIFGNRRSEQCSKKVKNQ